MSEKKVTSIRIDAQVLKAAQELGLNVSKISENALKEYIRRLTKPKTATNGGTNTQRSFLSEGSFTKESSMEPRARFRYSFIFSSFAVV